MFRKLRERKVRRLRKKGDTESNRGFTAATWRSGHEGRPGATTKSSLGIDLANFRKDVTRAATDLKLFAKTQVLGDESGAPAFDTIEQARAMVNFVNSFERLQNSFERLPISSYPGFGWERLVYFPGSPFGSLPPTERSSALAEMALYIEVGREALGERRMSTVLGPERSNVLEELIRVVTLNHVSEKAHSVGIEHPLAFAFMTTVHKGVEPQTLSL